MAPARKAPAQSVWTARQVAGIASSMTPRAWDAKDIRGLARGDSGPSVLPRFAEPNADGTNRQHSYTQAEVSLLLAAVAARFTRRTGQSVTVPAPFGAKPRKARKARTVKAPAVKAPAVAQAPTDAS